MENGIKSAKGSVESAILKPNSSTSDREMGPDQAYLGNVGHNNKLELVSVFPKDFSKVGPLRPGPNRGSDGVSFFEEDFDDVDGGETVRAGDEDFASWGDSWHVLLS